MERISHLFKNIITIAISIIIILSIEQSTYANEGPITDTNPPVLESFEFLEQGQKLSVGDTVHYRLKVTDDSGVDLDRTYPVIYSGDHYLSFKKTYNKSTGYIEGSYTFTEKDFNGTYSLGYIPCYDIYGNYYHGILSEPHYFTLVSGGISDVNPPTLESFEFLEQGQELSVGDTVHYRLKVTDDSGVDLDRTYPVIYSGDHYLSFKKTYNKSTGYIEGSYTFTEKDFVGTYSLGYIPCYDIYGNYYHGILSESHYIKFMTCTTGEDEHQWNTKYTVDKEATCKEEGSESIHCSICGTIQEKTSRVIPKTDHTYGNWRIKKEATCIKDGLKEKICSICNDKITETIPSSGHIWNTKYTVDKETTCKEEGSESIHCSVCGTIQERTSRVIPKTDHTYGNWRIKKEATCTKDGLKEKICSICNNKVTETIPLRGHVWNTKYTVDKKATYEAVGLKSIHCSTCDTIKPNSVVSIKKLKVKTPTVSKLIILKKGFIIKWKKITSANGYQVQYALNSKFTKSKKMVKITKTATVSKKVTKLKAKKKYYIRVRTYKVVSGKTYYSAWSKAKIVTTKK